VPLAQRGDIISAQKMFLEQPVTKRGANRQCYISVYNTPADMQLNSLSRPQGSGLNVAKLERRIAELSAALANAN